MRTSTWLAILLAVLVAGVTSAFAQQGEAIVVAGKIVARVRDKGPYESVAQRAAAVHKQIAECISKKEVGEPRMALKQENGLWTIHCATTRLISVYPSEAKANGLAERELAAIWLRNFERELPNAEPVVDRVKRLGDAAWEKPLPKPAPGGSTPPTTSMTEVSAATTAGSGPTTPGGTMGPAPTGRSTAVLAVLDAFSMVRALSDPEFDRARDELAENLITRLVPYISSATRVGVAPPTIGGAGTSAATPGRAPILVQPAQAPPMPVEPVGVAPLPVGPGVTTPTPVTPTPVTPTVKPVTPTPAGAAESRVPQKERIRRKWRALEQPLRTMQELGDPRADKLNDLLSIVRRDFYAGEFDSAEAAVDAALELAGITVQ